MVSENMAFALAQMAAFRQAELTAEALELYVRRLEAEQCVEADVIAACRQFEQTPRAEGETAFPELGRLLREIEAQARRRRMREQAARQLPASSDDEPTYRCWQCQDDPHGWLELWCPDTSCERTKEHAPHFYVVRCPHWLKDRSEQLHKATQEALQRGARPGPAAQALQELESNAYRYQRSVTVRGRRSIPSTETA